jgi:molybdenum cofactor cytidylyltransferase
MISGIVLAAGRSSRMGRAKQLLDLGGQPMLQVVLDLAERSRLDEVVVVLGRDAPAMWAALRPGPRTRVARNADFASGQSTSVRAGLRAVSREAEAAVVLLGDQPRLRVEVIDRVIAAFETGSGPVVQAGYGGRPGHPVLFSRDVWPEVELADGDEGARGVLARHPEWRTVLEVGGKPPEDVDTEEDYRRIRAAFSSGGSQDTVPR